MKMKKKFEFGVRELPKPKGEGYFYYRQNNTSDERVLAYLDLHDLQEETLSEVFRKGLLKLAEFENFPTVGFEQLLSGYKVSNMEPWAAEIFDKVIKSL